MIGYGIDLSHHQDPATLPWKSWVGKVDFVIARCAYGTQRDRACVEHIARARDIGAKVGIYTFFRNVESPDEQHRVVVEAAEACGLDDRDIVPAVDIERDPIPAPGREVSSTWSSPAEQLVDAIAKDFGNAMVYVTQREWGMLGAPVWVLRRPLWVAHFTALTEPATPGGLPATVWQHRVAAFDPTGPGGFFHADIQIDQNRLLRPFPLIGQVVTDEERERIEGLIALSLSESANLDDAPPKSIA